MTLTKKNIYLGLGIAAFLGTAIAYEQFRPISHEEVGISLIDKELCLRARLGIGAFGQQIGSSSDRQIEACSPPAVKLTATQQKEEQEELRTLYALRGGTSPDVWETSRALQELSMRSRRTTAELKQRSH